MIRESYDQGVYLKGNWMKKIQEKNKLSKENKQERRNFAIQATLAESAAALATQQRIAEAKSQRLSSAEQRAGIAESQSRQLRDEVEALEEQMRRSANFSHQD